MAVTVDYKGMEAYFRSTVHPGGGAMFGFLDFIKGDISKDARLTLQDLCVDIEGEYYELFDYNGVCFDFIDSTQRQTLAKMLRAAVEEVLSTGTIKI